MGRTGPIMSVAGDILTKSPGQNKWLSASYMHSSSLCRTELVDL